MVKVVVVVVGKVDFADVSVETKQMVSFSSLSLSLSVSLSSLSLSLSLSLAPSGCV
jgi:hypothetical protein